MLISIFKLITFILSFVLIAFIAMDIGMVVVNRKELKKYWWLILRIVLEAATIVVCWITINSYVYIER